MAFTIHGLDKKLDEQLSALARRQGTSKNKLVKKILARALGIASGDNEPDDYREFLGTWTEEDFRLFRESQAENDRIDAGDWQ